MKPFLGVGVAPTQAGVEIMNHKKSRSFIDDVIGMAWADEVSFDEIQKTQALSEADV